MREKLKLSSRPSGMRILLIVASLLIVLLMITIVFFAQKYLGQYATDVAQSTAESQDTQTSLDNLSRAKKELQEQQSAVEKARRIVAQSKEYQYQNQIINDLSAYAHEANITISGFMFDNPADKSTPSPSGGNAAANKNVAGLKSAQVVINLGGSIHYTDFLNFLALVENNATRMQIQGIDIAPAPVDTSAESTTPQDNDLISVRSLTIGVYIR